MAYNKRIAVDFDGVIHSYVTKWTKNWEINDAPIDGSFEWLDSLLESGITPIIHTCRFTGLKMRDRDRTISAVKDWFYEHGFEEESIDRLGFWLAPGKPHGGIYIDDRGFQFKGTYPSPKEILAFKPYKITDEPDYICTKCNGAKVQMVDWVRPNEGEWVSDAPPLHRQALPRILSRDDLLRGLWREHRAKVRGLTRPRTHRCRITEGMTSVIHLFSPACS